MGEEILTYPTSVWSTCWGGSHWNFAKIYGTRKLESLDYHVVLFV